VPARLIVAAAPAATVEGLMLVRVGDGDVIASDAAVESAVCGAGLCTVTFAERALVSNDAGSVVCSEVALTYVVTSDVPSSTTVEPETKFAPVTVSCVAVEPVGIDAGERELIVGGG
jgi:hypothetical protein